MNIETAIITLNSIPANTVREFATWSWDVAGADWNGCKLSLLRNGEWYEHSDALVIGLAQDMLRLGAIH